MARTVRQLAEQVYNPLVTRAHAEGKARWAKTRGDFPSRAVAEEAIARVRQELGEEAPEPAVGDGPTPTPPARPAVPRADRELEEVPKYRGPTRPHTVEIELVDGHKMEHKSMAPTWWKAIELAMWAIERDDLLAKQPVPVAIRVHEK